MEYQVLVGATKDALATAVEAALVLSWSLVGGVCVFKTPEGTLNYAQAMSKGP